MRTLREAWPLVAGVVAAAAIVVLFGATGAGREGGWRDGRPLGVAFGVWALALAVLVAALAAQLWLSARTSLARERRLVAAAAALRESGARLEQQAGTDTLTGLANRRVFAERLGVEYRRALRYGRPLSVLMVDLDHFKQINDRHGHPCGDRVLSEVAALVRSNVRESDLVARYGGEEFVVMLPEAQLSEALVVAEKLRAAVAALLVEDERASVQLTTSIGVAARPASAPRDEEDLIRLADEALYRAKAAGRDRVVAAPASGGANAIAVRGAAGG